MKPAVAISGTRRTMKELVDGTIRVQIDIDPRFRADFYRLLPDVDMGVALVPLAIGAALDSETMPEPAAPKAKAKFPDGFCGLAVMWCGEPNFCAWLFDTFPDYEALCPTSRLVDPVSAAWMVKAICGVTSRKELNTDDIARAKFDSLIREPYARYRKELGLE